MAWDVLVDNETGRVLQKEIELARSAFLATIAHQKTPFGGEVSLVFVNDGQMRDINHIHRGKNATTDVLSFPQYEACELGGFTNADFVIFGDIVVNIDKAYEQAVKYGHNEEREIAFLMVHSTLHLLGYDHKTIEGDKEMRKIQEEVLTQMGLSRHCERGSGSDLQPPQGGII